MQVKIIFASNDYDEINWDRVQSSLTDWEEIGEEDFKLLKLYLYDLVPDDIRRAGFVPKILVKDPVPVMERIYNLKELLKARKEKEEADKRKREEARLKKQLAKSAKQELSEKELYEHLRSKFEKGA